jgi:hypothetical protein
MVTGRPARRRLGRPPLALGLALALLALAAPAPAAQDGKLAGRIVDEAGEPLVGSTVLVVGTDLGSAADGDGAYVVLRVPVGVYTVRVSSVGYTTQMIEGVRFASNQTTALDVTLREETVAGEELVVVADRPIIDTGQTSSIATVGRDEIDALPVQDIADIVALQAGVVAAGDGAHFRGGRVGEVQYQIDGVTVNNPYNNSSTVELDRSVLQEVQVISGTFDAEYGQALSGVVNAVLRSGDEDRYEFSFETYLGDYVSPGNDSVVVNTQAFGEVELPRYPYIDDLTPTALQNYQASFSGPVPFAGPTTFLLNAQRNVDNGYLFGTRIFLPTDSTDFDRGILEATGDRAVVPLGFNRRWSFLGKVTNRSVRNVELSYQALANLVDKTKADRYFRFRFNPDAAITQRENSLVHGLDFTHVLSGRTYYEIGLRQNYFDYTDYLYEDARDPRYFDAGLPVNFPDPFVLTGAAIQGVDLTRFTQRTNALVAKGALTAQVTTVHLFKLGLEVQRAALRFGVPGRLQNVTDSTTGRVVLGVVEDSAGARVLDYTPVQAAAFAQDRVEWGDLRVRVGLRLEVFDANATVPSDLQNPANAIAGAPESHPVGTSVKWALAPRLGVSFPILDRASMFFSYGHFYQMPGLGLLFDNADYSVLRDLQDDDEARGRVGVIGNPDLQPEFTAQYEFGFKSEIVDDVGLDVSLFYKDIRDLLGVEFISLYSSADYARFTNVDFGGVRGLTVALDQRRFGPVATTLDYTYQEAIGNASDPKETFTRAQAGDDARPREVPFNWDQRHTLNATAVWARPRSFSVTGIFRLGSGQPYSPSLGSASGAEPETNSGRKPASVTVDLRAERFFRFGGLDLTAFARVFNLFDSHFASGFVYADTGSPYYTSINERDQFGTDPSRFAAPRRIEIGVSLRGALPR